MSERLPQATKTLPALEIQRELKTLQHDMEDDKHWTSCHQSKSTPLLLILSLEEHRLSKAIIPFASQNLVLNGNPGMRKVFF